MDAVEVTARFVVTSVICVLIVIPYIVASEGVLRRFGRDSNFDGYRCSDVDFEFTTYKPSAVSCSVICVETENCVSYFYTRTSSMCYGCRVSYSDTIGLPVISGTKYYKVLLSRIVCLDSPSDIAHGSYTVLSTFVGGLTSYTCSANYGIDGNTTSTCLKTGLWTAPPVCLKDCGTPPIGDMLFVSNASSRTLEGATLTYECVYNQGSCVNYVLYGSPTVTCQTSGKWTTLGATCLTILESGFLPDGITSLSQIKAKGCMSEFGSTGCSDAGSISDGLLYTGVVGACYCDIVCCDPDYKDCCYDSQCSPDG